MTNTLTARVFYSDGTGNARADDPSIAPGWYYAIDDEAPRGPWSGPVEAGRAAREEIIARTACSAIPIVREREANCREPHHYDDGIPYCDKCGLYRDTIHRADLSAPRSRKGAP